MSTPVPDVFIPAFDLVERLFPAIRPVEADREPARDPALLVNTLTALPLRLLDQR